MNRKLKKMLCDTIKLFAQPSTVNFDVVFFKQT